MEDNKSAQPVPKVSVVIPVANRAHLVGETLDSVRGQSESSWECLVVDDGSTDGTVDLVRSYCSADQRFRLQINGGGQHNANVCRNLGLQAARGKYVVFLDSDDLLVPDCLSQRLNLIEASQYDYVAFLPRQFEKRPGDLNTILSFSTRHSYAARFILQDAVWQTTGPIWRTAFVRANDGWLESLELLQDFEFHARMLLEGAKGICLNESDYFVRLSEEHRQISDGWRSKRILISAKITMLRSIVTTLHAANRCASDFALRPALMSSFYNAMSQSWNQAWCASELSKLEQEIAEVAPFPRCMRTFLRLHLRSNSVSRTLCLHFAELLLVKPSFYVYHTRAIFLSVNQLRTDFNFDSFRMRHNRLIFFGGNARLHSHPVLGFLFRCVAKIVSRLASPLSKPKYVSSPTAAAATGY